MRLGKTLGILCLVLVPLLSFAQKAPPPASKPLEITDLPVYHTVGEFKSKQYQQQFPPPLSDPSPQDLDRSVNQIKQAIDERSKSKVDEERLVQDIVASPSYLNDIASSVHLLMSSPHLSYASAPLSHDYVQGLAQNYLDSLDPFKIFFCQSDLAHLINKKQEQRILSALQGEDQGWVFDVFEQYQSRQQSFLLFAKEFLSTSELPSEGVWKPSVDNWPTCNKAQKDRWTSSIGDDFISIHIQENDLEESKKKMLEMYQESVARTNQMTKLDVLEVFLRSYSEYVDPHSLYLAPRSKSQFKSQFHNVLEGVGVVWSKKQENIVVERIIPNSPASEGAALAVGDVLISIGHDETKMVSVVGLRTEDVVDLTRGPIGTKVVFVLKDKDGKEKRVELERRSIQLSANVVTSKRYTVGDYSVLAIKLPNFYSDQANPNRQGGSVSYDIKQVLLKEPRADLVLLDLRGNGGGIMSEAIAATSLFVDQGTVVQIQSATGKKQVYETLPNQAIWKGPLAVLIDERSASASEIMAASLQDTNRALIVGQQSYGKGTAQTLLDLDLVSSAPSSVFGQLNVTAMMFFRPLGDSTQMKGVMPDVKIGEGNLSGLPTGERAFKRALPPSSVSPENDNALPAQGPYPWQARRSALQKASQERWSSQPWHSLWVQLSVDHPKKPRTLDYEVRAQEVKQRKEAQDQLRKMLAEQGRSLADGMGGDVVMREAIFVAKDAFSGVHYRNANP